MLFLTGVVVFWCTRRLDQALSEEELVWKRVRQLRNVSGSKFELQIREDEAKQVPGLGDGGVPVHLEGEEQILAEKLMKKEAFNIILSNKIPYNRKLPYARNLK